MSEKADRVSALIWAAETLEQWTAHFSTREQRRVGDWLATHLRTEACRIEHDLPDNPSGLAAAYQLLEGAQ